jgi:hypothetical protein
MLGRKLSEKTRRKISEANRRRKQTEETRRKISENHRGNKNPMFGIKGNKNPLFGRHLSEDAKRKIGDANRGEKSFNWLGGISFEPYGITFNRKLKEQIRQRDNYECQECHTTQEQAGYNLPVHHIDYNKKNNAHENLITLCKSCHSQTNFSRADWTKYFKGLDN